jgi:hypothetical protein
MQITDRFIIDLHHPEIALSEGDVRNENVLGRRLRKRS